MALKERNHVDYFCTTFRGFPERVEKVTTIVGVLEDVLIENTMRADGNDNADLLERAHEYVDIMTDFLFNEDGEMDGGYTSSVSSFPDVFLDRNNCLLTCYMLEEAREGVVTSIGPLWLAFSSVCRSEMGLEPEIVMKAFAPQSAVSLIEDFRFELDQLDPERDVDRETESALRSLWRTCTS